MAPRLAATDLPVEDCIASVRQALAGPGHAVLQAPPGAGKTTIVPLRLLDEPWLGDRRIVVLEPRRLATRAAAVRMASLLGEPVGATVGYRTRDERRSGPDTRVEIVTEGILTRRLQHDAALPGVALVVFDEVHERNLQTDVALALALDARAVLRPDLRLLAMSATLDTGRIAEVLGGMQGAAPAVTSEGRQYPVDVRWAPPPPRLRLAEAVASVVVRALRENDGDVLAFLPGAGEIRRTEVALAAAGLGRDGAPALTGPLGPAVDVRPLFGALPIADQDAALAGSPPGRRRVVLATDIAETSLTVEGVRVVVDGGQVRSPRYDPRSGLTRLQTGAHSRASADQRAGRAGRVAPGVAYRLWSQVEHAARRPFPEPEISSVDLAGLALELAVWGAEATDLAFLDPPPDGTLAEGRALLRELGALDDGGRPTRRGLAMVELPLHPRLARMVVDAPAGDQRWTACLLAALLEERDVLRGPPDQLPIDIGERVRLLVDRGARHPAADGRALSSTRRRAKDVAGRAGVRPVTTEDAADADVDACGPLLALAYPDRVAQARGGARFRLRNGNGAWVPAGDPLAGEAFLAVVELDADRRDSRIRMAAALDAADVEAVTREAVEPSGGVVWDERRDDLRHTVSRRAGGLVLAESEGPAAPGPDATAALLDQVRSSRLRALRWTDAARSLQARILFLRRTFGDDWPDVSDAALLAALDDWLAPRLVAATSRADLEAVDLAKVLHALTGPGRRAALDELAPPAVTTAAGRRLAVDYRGEPPAVEAKVQDLFGTSRHPTVAGGRVPVLVRLLSPAGRPVQVTADLPGFWAGSYAAVRKDMAGRYPKHAWPRDPLDVPASPTPAARAPRPRKRRR